MTLELSDCDRRISLEFDLHSEGYRENSLHTSSTRSSRRCACSARRS